MGIIYLTPYDTKCGEATANGPNSEPEAGAPENEIAITPEMIAAGLIPFLRFYRESSDDETVVREMYLAMVASRPTP